MSPPRATSLPTRLTWNLDLVRRFSAPELALYDEY